MRKKCAGIVGLIQEGDDLMGEDYEDGAKDAALISAAQRFEHYGMAAYGCVRTWLDLLGDSEAKDLLEQNCLREKETDQTPPTFRRSTYRQMTDQVLSIHAAPALDGTKLWLACHP